MTMNSATDQIIFGNSFGYTGGTAPPMMYAHPQQYGEMMPQPQYQEVVSVVPWQHENVMMQVPQAPQPPAPAPAPVQNSIVLPPVQPPAPASVAQEVPQKVQETVAFHEPTKSEPTVVVQHSPETIDPCCSTPVSLGCFGVVGVSFFVIFVTITGVMVWGRQFCNGYWQTANNPSMFYQLSGLSTVAVWALIMGSSIFTLGLLWFLENRAAINQARALRDQIRTLLLLLSLFSLAWLACGNTWVIGRPADTFMGITALTGMIPDACKQGNMGDNNFYWFCYVIIVILDILAPLAMLYAFIRTFLNKTFVG